MTDKEFKIKLGKRILKRRNELHMTQMELAKKIKKFDTVIRRMEKGSNSTILVLRKVARELKISLSDLLKDIE